MAGLSLLDLAIFVLVMPIVEELIFRGVVQEQLYRALPKDRGRLLWISRANLGTSILFVLAHWLFRDSLTALLVFPASLLFGWLYERHHSLTLPVLAHILANACFLVVTSFLLTDTI